MTTYPRTCEKRKAKAAVGLKLTGLILLSITLSAAAAFGANESSFHKATLDRHFSQLKNADHGVVFTRLSDGKALYEFNAASLLSPASVTKILTSAASLAYYGPAHTFKTPIYYTGTFKDGILSGDLIIKGVGDPFLVSEVLWQTAVDLKHLGLKQVRGNIVLDLSLFDDETRDDSRLTGLKRSTHAYDAPVSAFAVNFNTLAVSVAPGFAANKPAIVELSPFPMASVKVQSSVKTMAGAGDSVSASRKSLTNQNSELTVSGMIGNDAPLKKIYRSVGDPNQASFDYVRGFLRGAGIEIKGTNKISRTPSDATTLYQINGYEMRRIAAGLNTFSNNFIADMLTKKLGASFSNPTNPELPGSGQLESGINVMHDFLKKTVRLSGEFTLLNGSGLSTENRLTARQINDVLVWMETQGDLFPDFLGGLPASGLDGTLKKRMRRNDDLTGMIRAKTGTLTEPITVAGMAGYFRHAKEGWVAFTMITNGRAGKGQPGLLDARKLQDDVFKIVMSASD